ncbi:MAG: hypothetical protein R2824_14390 [Saprospiraceae bacterium]|nr:hypothetical protein [Lewinella sp.]
MKKDILQKEADQLAVVISPRENQSENNDLWDTYLINLSDEPLTSVLVCSKGYGEVNGEKMSTTTLRHFYEEIGPRQLIPIEPIQTSLFQLTNEFWISFVQNGYMFDKKYIFTEGSINQSQFTDIPYSERQGVMIR